MEERIAIYRLIDGKHASRKCFKDKWKALEEIAAIVAKDARLKPSDFVLSWLRSDVNPQDETINPDDYLDSYLTQEQIKYIDLFGQSKGYWSQHQTALWEAES